MSNYEELKKESMERIKFHLSSENRQRRVTEFSKLSWWERQIVISLKIIFPLVAIFLMVTSCELIIQNNPFLFITIPGAFIFAFLNNQLFEL